MENVKTPTRYMVLMDTINKALEELKALGANVYDDENPEWAVEALVYNPDEDEIFAKFREVQNG